MIRVVYLTNANLTLKRAHTLNVLETADGLQKTGRVSVEILQHPTWRELRRRAPGFDVIYFRDHHLAHIIWVAKLLLRKTVVYEVHSTHGFSLLRRLAFSIADAEVFITSKLRDVYDPKRRKMSKIVHCNGIDLKDYAFLETTSKEALRAELDLPQGVFLGVYIGSMLWYDLPLLVAALSHLPADTRFLFVGLKDEEVKSLKALAEKMGIGDRVLLRGRAEHYLMPRYLGASDVLVNPLISDLPGGISSKLYEYLAAGRPIVSTFGGANDEVLRDRENCLVADLAPESFATCIQELRADPALAERIVRRAREDAKQYTKEKRAEAITDLIVQLHNT